MNLEISNDEAKTIITILALHKPGIDERLEQSDDEYASTYLTAVKRDINSVSRKIKTAYKEEQKIVNDFRACH